MDTLIWMFDSVIVFFTIASLALCIYFGSQAAVPDNYAAPECVGLAIFFGFLGLYSGRSFLKLQEEEQ